jgi:hypothetical protein
MRYALLHGLVCALTFSVTALDARADDSTRCRNGRLVDVGMVAAEIVARCGEPKSRTGEDVPIRVRTAAGGTAVIGTTRVERWVYERGQGQFDALFTFEDGKLVDIELLTTR